MKTSRKRSARAEASTESGVLTLASGSNTIFGSNESQFCSPNTVLIKCEPRTSESLEEAENDDRSQSDEISTSMRLAMIEARLSAMEETQNQILALLRQHFHVPEEIQESDSFDNKYNTSLPCKTLIEFFELNDKLGENDTCGYDLSNLLKFCADGSGGIGKTTSQILKLCMSRDVALRLTAQKQMPNKIVMKSMPIYNIFSNVLKYVHNNISEKNILSAIGDSLSNAKDWDGHRKKRFRKDDEATKT